MDTLRTPLFVLAIALMALVVAFELGTALFPASAAVSTQRLVAMAGEQLRRDPELRDDEDAREEILDAMREDLADLQRQEKPPGLAIPYMALLDGLLLYTALLMGLSLVVPERLHGRVQGILTLIVSLLILLACIALFFVAFALLLVMVGLFLATPFGTIAYMALYGFFNRGGAAAALSLGMTLKLGFAACLLLAQQRFLQNKGLVLMILTSLVASIVVGFLHNLVPLFLVSITDAIGALVMTILAGLWAILLLIGAIISVIKAIL